MELRRGRRVSLQERPSFVRYRVQVWTIAARAKIKGKRCERPPYFQRS